MVERRNSAKYVALFATITAVILVVAMSSALRVGSATQTNFIVPLRAAKHFGKNASSLPVEGDMPSLKGASAWLNSDALSAQSLRGKVVLVDFWTYSCINWRRTEPYIRAWAEKYRDKGLVVIGVHSPEFDFEKDLSNVRQAVSELNISYPVLVDSELATWNAFNNAYWPAVYLADARGRIRYHKFGEGDYDATERAIQQLVTEAGSTLTDSDLVSVRSVGAEAAPDWDNLHSPENYVGYARTIGFDSPGKLAKNKPRDYAPPDSLSLNHWALAGDWTVRPHDIVLNKASGRIAYRFHARDLHLVMGPAVRGSAIRFRVLVDGHAPGDAHGVDVDAEGNGTVSEPRMYQLLRQPGAIRDRQFEIEFQDPGVIAYSFTFG